MGPVQKNQTTSVIALLTAFAVVISLLLQGGRIGIGDPDPDMTQAKFWIYVLGLELRLMVWAGFYLLIAGSRDLLALQARSAELELAVTRAQLRLLSAAFQPHFLMNAMNTLIACRHDPEAVETAGEGLAGYLRYALDRSSGELEPLAIQLEALSNYINVEELRFDEQHDITTNR
jgi:sensor histidine kinase YesM